MSEAKEATREAILGAAAEPSFAFVNVPAWGNVRVYALPSGEKDAFDRETIRRRKKTPDRIRFGERILIACVRDADGRPLFTAADEDALAAIPAGQVARPVRAAMKLSGWFEDDEDGDDSGN